MTISPITDPGIDRADPAAGPGHLAGRAPGGAGRRRAVRHRCPAADRLQRLDRRRRAPAATSRAPSPSRRRGSTRSTATRSSSGSPRTASRADGPIVVYGASADDDAARRRPAPRGRRSTGSATLDGRLGGLGWTIRTGRSSRCPATDSSSHPAWLRAVLDGERPEAAPDGPALLFHVNFGVPEEYAEGHLPGRPLPRHELAGGPGRLEPPLAGGARRRRSGRSASRTTRRSILYGRDTEGDANEKWPGRRAGQIAATRAALILTLRRRRRRPDPRRRLRPLGPRGQPARDDAARADAGRAPSGRRSRSGRSSSSTSTRRRQIIADPDGAALVSVRTWREHIGAVSGYNYIGPAGRISGDVWGNCGTDAYHMQHYRTVDNTMRPYPEIAANWAEAGITPDKWVAFYCGTGWRASETWFYATLRAGRGSPCTTAAGSSGARTPSTTRSRSATRRARPRTRPRPEPPMAAPIGTLVA